ncbi:hypothetical protein T492DRAFT_1084573 [Pavlovales sp. CCMP2436]|nr:hypothetical protein T492DRAFT_1084573 [Pavlovales sp. CCMP2436]
MRRAAVLSCLLAALGALSVAVSLARTRLLHGARPRRRRSTATIGSGSGLAAGTAARNGARQHAPLRVIIAVMSTAEEHDLRDLSKSLLLLASSLDVALRGTPVAVIYEDMSEAQMRGLHAASFVLPNAKLGRLGRPTKGGLTDLRFVRIQQACQLAFLRVLQHVPLFFRRRLPTAPLRFVRFCDAHRFGFELHASLPTRLLSRLRRAGLQYCSTATQWRHRTAGIASRGSGLRRSSTRAAWAQRPSTPSARSSTTG